MSLRLFLPPNVTFLCRFLLSIASLFIKWYLCLLWCLVTNAFLSNSFSISLILFIFFFKIISLCFSLVFTSLKQELWKTCVSNAVLSCIDFKNEESVSLLWFEYNL